MFQSTPQSKNFAPTLSAMVLALASFGCGRSEKLISDAPKPQTDEYVCVIRDSKAHLITSTSEPSKFGFTSLEYDTQIGQLVGTAENGQFIVDVNTGTPAHEKAYTFFKSSNGILYGVVGGSCWCNQYEPIKFLPNAMLSNNINIAP